VKFVCFTIHECFLTNSVGAVVYAALCYLTAAIKLPKLGLYHANDPTPEQLAINSDDKLFSSVLTNSRHVLKQLLPDETTAACQPPALNV